MFSDRFLAEFLTFFLAGAGCVRLFNCPAVKQRAECARYGGHSSHIMMARFTTDGRRVISVGGWDRTVIQWRVIRKETGVASSGTVFRAERVDHVFETSNQAFHAKGNLYLCFPWSRGGQGFLFWKEAGDEERCEALSPPGTGLASARVGNCSQGFGPGCQFMVHCL